jgi:uncharacterized phage protein (TIGR02218 family)
MKSASPGLISLLTSGNEFYMADLYTFSLVGGTALRYCTADGGITYGGNFFDGNSVAIERSKIRTVIGVEVDTLDMTIAALPSHTVLGAPFLQALRNGVFDGATLKMERCFMPTWGDTSLGTVILFFGTVADMEVGRLEAKVRVNSALQLLDIQMPRNVYQPGCLNTLFDGACTISKASWGIGSTVSGGATASSIPCSLSNAAGWFDMGTIIFTSGTLNGVTRSVKQYTPGNVGLMLPLPSAPAAGDTFTAYAGCDKSQATCTNKFNNEANFRGFPFVPVPESVI